LSREFVRTVQSTRNFRTYSVYIYIYIYTGTYSVIIFAEAEKKTCRKTIPGASSLQLPSARVVDKYGGERA